MTEESDHPHSDSANEQSERSPLFGVDEPSGFQRMSTERFHALALWGLAQDFREAFLPISFWSAENERLLAVVYEAQESSAIGLGIIARDETGRYRPFAHQKSMGTVRAAEDAIMGSFGHSALALEPKFPALEQLAGTDLFAPIRGVESLHPAFEVLRESVRQRAARELLIELSKWVPDRDGNLARDFQTTGYSARVWELYLTFALRDLNFRLSYRHPAPDFHLTKGGQEIFVEATTANAADPTRAAMADGLPPAPKDFWNFIEREMPLKLGSPLHSKMRKRYWELDHVKGRPFILAIADFHAPASMIWSHTAVPIYLYGRSAAVSTNENGRRLGVEKRITSFAKGERAIIPFFEQPDTEHVSAVLFSNAGTIAKFNRMGTRAGYGDRFVMLRRSGGWFDPSPDAFEPILFDLDVESPLYRERWADELQMFHNPRAHRPIEEDLFPGVTHFAIEDGEAIWRGPTERILFSHTNVIDLLGRGLPKDENAGD